MERRGEPRIVALARELIERGHADRLLLSQDVCHNSQLTAYGGNGYVHLFEDVPAPAPGRGRVRVRDPPDDSPEPGADPGDVDRRAAERRWAPGAGAGRRKRVHWQARVLGTTNRDFADLADSWTALAGWICPRLSVARDELASRGASPTRDEP